MILHSECEWRRFWRRIQEKKALTLLCAAFLCFSQMGLYLLSSSFLLHFGGAPAMFIYGVWMLFDARTEFRLRETPDPDWLSERVS